MRFENKLKVIRVPSDDSVSIWSKIGEELEALGAEGWQVSQVHVKDNGLAADLVMSRPVGLEDSLTTTKNLVSAIGSACLSLVTTASGPGRTDVGELLRKALKMSPCREATDEPSASPLRRRLLNLLRQWGPGGCKVDLGRLIDEAKGDAELRREAEKALKNWERISHNEKCDRTERRMLRHRADSVRAVLRETS